jgi:hypothetical protein
MTEPAVLPEMVASAEERARTYEVLDRAFRDGFNAGVQAERARIAGPSSMLVVGLISFALWGLLIYLAMLAI